MSTCWYLTGVVAPNRRKAKRKLAERKTAGVRRSSVLGVGKSLERVFRSVSNLVKGHTSIEKAKRASIQVATDSVYKSKGQVDAYQTFALPTNASADVTVQYK